MLVAFLVSQPVDQVVHSLNIHLLCQRAKLWVFIQEAKLHAEHGFYLVTIDFLSTVESSPVRTYQFRVASIGNVHHLVDVRVKRTIDGDNVFRYVEAHEPDWDELKVVPLSGSTTTLGVCHESVFE